MVRQYDAQNWCDTELRRYGLWNQGWRTNFSKATHLSDGRSFIAACFFTEKRIVFSIPHLNARGEAETKQTIKHEIAHALVGHEHGHDEVWAAKAKELGLENPKPCGTGASIDEGRATSPVETKPERLIKSVNIYCPHCHQIFEVVSRMKMGGKEWMKGKCGHLVSREQVRSPLAKIDSWVSYDGSRTIFPYQAEGIKFVANANGRALIADEPGLGKTAQAFGCLHFFPEMRPALWVCKTTLKLQAIKEGLIWGGPELMGQIIEHGKMFILPGLNLYVISMDLLRNMPTEKLEEIPFKTVIADEIQHFKNPDSTRTAELRKLVARAEYFIPLSGTPWKNRGSEYFPVLNMLKPEMFPSPKHFKNTWVDTYIDNKTGKIREGGIRNIPQFREITKSFIIRRMRDDVLPDLPKINSSIRFVDMDEESKKEYNKEEGHVAAMIRAAMIDGKPMNSIAAMIMTLKHITGRAKVPALVDDTIEWLDDTTENEKITLFHHHIDVGNEIQSGVKGEYEGIDNWLVANGYNKSLRLYGGKSPEERDYIINQFKIRQENRVLIASTLASGEGLNIQFCQNAAMLERQWNPQNEEQAEMRFSRPLTYSDYPKYLQYLLFDENHNAKKTSVRIPYYIAAGTVDEILTNIIERKRLNFRKSMNAKDEFLTWDENEIIKEVAEFIIKKRYKKAS